VSEVLKDFVCIRVDVDKEPAIAARHGTKAMPDLRLLDPEGRELQRLLGFTSPERLAKECRRVLDRLAGKDVAVSTAEAAHRDVAATEANVAAAVLKARQYLEQEVARGLPADAGVAGLDDAVVLGLLAAGVARDSRPFTALLQSTLDTPLTGIYQAAFRAMALARLGDPDRKQRLRECCDFLQNTQLADGTWSYGADRAATGDHSNSAYALLGLAAAAHAGIDVSKDVVQSAEAAWRARQNADGGFGYRRDRESESYASMTESGITSLYLCRHLLGNDTAQPDAAMSRALDWLAAHASVRENTGSAYQQGRQLYHLYALERTGSMLGRERLGDLDWYQRGAEWLLGSQREDGSFDDGAETPLPNTVFAILFLTRASREKS
jgi:hypothetical protein